MPNKQLIKELYDNFHQLIKDETAADVAIPVLIALYAKSRPNLTALLNEYYESTVVFYPLTTLSDPAIFTPLFTYLIDLNENILTMPLHKRGVPSETLLELFLDENKKYENIINWLHTNKPALIAAEKKQAHEVEKLQRLVINFLDNNKLDDFYNLFTINQPIKLIHQVLIAYNNELLDQLLDEPSALLVNALNFIVKLDVSILKIKYASINLFSYLCNDPITFASTLSIIKDMYQDELSTRQLSQLERACEPVPLNSPTFNSDSLYNSSTNPNGAIINKSTLNTLALTDSPFQLLDERLSPFIDTHLRIDNAVLDVYIAQTFTTELMKQGIIVMPTIRHTEAISLDQIERIKAGEKILYQDALIVNTEDIEVCGISEIQPIKPPRYLIWPINNEQIEHYGLFILDLTDSSTVLSSRGYYIEPLRLENILISQERVLAPYLQAPINYNQLINNKIYRQQLVTQISPFLYQAYIRQLTVELPISADAFRYIHLGQDPSVNYCSDYVIAILAKLAAGEIDLIGNKDSLFSLETTYLDEATVRAIRLLEIQRFKMDYFEFQLPPTYKAPAAREAIKQYVLSEKTDPHAAATLKNVFLKIHQEKLVDAKRKRKAEKNLDENLKEEPIQMDKITTPQHRPKRNKTGEEHGVFLKKIMVEVDLLQYPKIDTTHPANADIHITMGDGHGNALKLLYMLIRQGITTDVSEEMYEQFVAIYKKSIDISLLAEDIDNFNNILDDIEFNSQATILLLGDLLADRGGNDYFTLRILQKLYQCDVSVQITLSNHDFNFIQNYEQSLQDPVNAFQFSDLSSSSSMLNMGFLIEEGILKLDEIHLLIEEAYLPALKVLSYTVNDDETAITIYSHAPIDLNNVRYLARYFEVPYQDSTVAMLAETIDAINRVFETDYMNANLIHELIEESIEEELSDAENEPVHHVMWNRKHIDLNRPSEYCGYQLTFVHGHHTYEVQDAHIVNLDNQLGKGAHYTGQYGLLYSMEYPYLQKTHSEALDSSPVAVGRASQSGLFRHKPTYVQQDLTVEDNLGEELTAYLNYTPSMDQF